MGLALLVLFGAAACKNADKAKLLSLPVPEGSEFERVQAARLNVFEKFIVYRVPLPKDEAEAEVYRLLEDAGWGRRSRGWMIRDGDCISIRLTRWYGYGRPTEYGSDDNSFLQLSLVKDDNCGFG